MSNAVALSGPASFIAAEGVRAIVPATFQSVWEMADLLSKSGMTPNGIKTREQVAVALFHGLEIGLTPMAALQSIAVINGRPSIWGDGALALVRNSPLCEGVKEWTENKGTDKEVAYCEVKRKGGEVIRREFSYDDAKAAKLLDKAGPWKEYRSRMMQMRARAFALRDGFADVLRGLAIAEELQDVAPRDVTPEAPVPPSAVIEKKAEPAKAESQKAPAKVVEGEVLPPAKEAAAKREPDPEDDAPSPPKTEHVSGYVEGFCADCDAAPTMDDLRDLWSNRDRSYDGTEDGAAMIAARDRNKARFEGASKADEKREEPRSSGQAEPFSEPAYRSSFLDRLKAATTGDEALKLNDEAQALIESGQIGQDEFAEFYEDALSTAIERLP